MVKKLTSAILVISIMLSVLVIPASAADYSTSLSFKDYLIEHYKNFEEEIDITYYMKKNGWDLSTAKEKILDVVYDTPELFYVNVTFSLKTIGSYNLVTGVNYICKKSELADVTAEIEAAAKKALRVTNKSMSSGEKLLALHDYFCVNIRYDTKTHSMANGYDALVKGGATCQGYARGMSYLLWYAGYENMVVREKSSNMNHGWNLVKVGENWYHLDTTKDDPLMSGNDSYGRVSHNYVLRSDAAMLAAGFSWDQSKYPAATKTTYDKRPYLNVKTNMVKLGAYWYYIEEDKEASNNTAKETYANLYRYDYANNKRAKVYTIKSTWYSWGTEGKANQARWSGNYSGLNEYNGKIYFSDAKSIYCFDPITNEVSKIYTPKDLKGYIYGMNMKGNQIIYSVKQKPSTDAESLKTVKVEAATATKIAVEKTSLTANAGTAYTLKTTLTPSDSKDFVYWESSNTSVATVDINGKITFKKAGTATISAYTARGAKSSCKVTVK